MNIQDIRPKVTREYSIQVTIDKLTEIMRGQGYEIPDDAYTYLSVISVGDRYIEWSWKREEHNSGAG